jgi:hypothetical protein
MTRLAIFSLTLLMAVLFTVPLVNATPIIEISDGVNPTLTIADNNVNGTDRWSQLGFVGYSGSIGSWNVSVDVSTKPYVGTAEIPLLDLGTYDISSTGGGTLTIRFTETGYGPLPANYHFEGNYGGTTNNANIQYQTYLDSSNVAFGTNTAGTAILLGDSGLRGPGYFGGWFRTPVISEDAYSITQVITVTSTGAPSLASGNFDLKAVPEPSTLLLLGCGLCSIGVYVRRKK